MVTFCKCTCACMDIGVARGKAVLVEKHAGSCGMHSAAVKVPFTDFPLGGLPFIVSFRFQELRKRP